MDTHKLLLISMFMEPRDLRSKTDLEVRGLYSKSLNHTDRPARHQMYQLRWRFVFFYTAADPYVIISCESQSVKSSILKDTLQPEFKTSGIFYRKKPRKPITVEVRQILSSPCES